jgi:hypothetical protein
MLTRSYNKGSLPTLKKNRLKFRKRRHPLICSRQFVIRGSLLTLKRNGLKFWKRRHPLHAHGNL